MENEFEEGEVVQLKSGGPKMTVSSFHRDSGKYLCEWFAEGTHKEQLFKATSIEKFVSGGFF